VYTQNASVVLYNEASKKLIYQLKYGDARYVAYHIGNLMSDKLKLKPGFLETIDFMIPIPISQQRLGERGFNQATLIAGYISERTHLEVESEVVERFIHTSPQTKLNRAERKENLKGVFRVKEPDLVVGKRILLIDDVITTGSTLNEVAKELIKMGAYEVYGLTLAAPTTR
jgi:ComF family protein